MTELRQIQTIQNNTITIQLPEGFSTCQQAEVIVLPLEENAVKQTDTEQFIRRFAGAIPDFPEVESEGLPEERRDF